MAAVLAYRGRAAVSHQSAGAMLAITRRPKGLVHLTVDREIRARRGIVLDSRRLVPTDIRRRERIPLTSPARTLSTLARPWMRTSSNRPRRKPRPSASSPALSSNAQVDEHPHRPGTPSLRALSELDRDPALTARRPSAAPQPDPHANLPSKLNGAVGPHEVDACAGARLVIDFDIWTFHSSRQAFERDRRKDPALLALGYRVLRITWRRLTREAEAVDFSRFCAPCPLPSRLCRNEPLKEE